MGKRPSAGVVWAICTGSLGPHDLVACVAMALPTTEPFIAAAEAHLGVALPGWLRARLLLANGGNLEAEGEHWELFSVLDTTDRRRITRSATHIPGETAAAREWVGFPPQAIAIASNGGGDYLILMPDGQMPSRLCEAPFIWLHGVDEPPVQIAIPAP